MKYKLIVSDLDGTALNSHRAVSPRTVKAIADYRKAGGTFILSTGRMYESVIQVVDSFGLGELNVPICAMDGGIIRESKTGKIIELNTLPYEKAAAFAAECERRGSYFQVYSVDKLYVAEENEINREYCAHTKVKMNVVGCLSKYISDNKLQCVKVLVASKTADAELEYFKDRIEGVQFFLSDVEYLDGASVKAGKGNALRTVAKHYGISLDNTIAIGDSMNDVSMVSIAGLGVAMGNADERLKRVAKMIAPSCDEDGLAVIIEKAIRDEL
ncbi:MAG: HAD family phosphatase [Clostridiales bacterium]|nr:HAD family phosphatase [Clostridiales bacterium]